jgi:HSP20 family molecular chaperone IbpA
MLRDPDSEPPWVPRADMFMDSAGDLTIKVELAALRRQDVELFVEDQKIRITGHRPDVDRDADGSRYLATGINWGWFDMVVDVPEGFDLTRARAQYQNGLLRVLVPSMK